MSVRPKKLNQAQSGQALVEYGLLFVLVTLVCVGALQLMGLNLSTLFGATLLQVHMF